MKPGREVVKMVERTWRQGYVPGKAKKTIHIDDEVARALEIRAAQERVSQAEIVERALRKELGLMIHWSELELIGRDNQPITDEDQIHRALDEFRRTNSMNGVFFERLGLPHEDEEDASTWGPESPEHVDWTGFSEA